MRAFIIHRKFSQNGRIVLGGVETYIIALYRLLNKNGIDATVIQPGIGSYKEVIDGVIIETVNSNGLKNKKLKRKMTEFVISQMNSHEDIIIFAADWFSYNCGHPRSILIQHGISWDLPSPRPSTFGSILKLLGKRRHLRNFHNAEHKVCVDYNFLNWAKSTSVHNGFKNTHVILNFSDIPLPKERENTDHTKIVFARRFTEYRGTVIMAEAASALLEKHKNISFCFAGDGPCSNFLQERFKNEPRCIFKKYDPKDSVIFHQDFDIAIVPSLGSEGTSLSLIEAMAAGCAVVCSNVGGMTNIVINNYNGLVIEPNTKSLCEAISYLLENPNKVIVFSERGRQIVSSSLSREIWERQWMNIIMSL